MANDLTDDLRTPNEPGSDDSVEPAEAEMLRSGRMAPKRGRANSGSTKALMPWTWNWKARPSVYTVMLALSLVFVTIGCVLLWIELQQWGDYPWWKTTESMPQGGG